MRYKPAGPEVVMPNNRYCVGSLTLKVVQSAGAGQPSTDHIGCPAEGVWKHGFVGRPAEVARDVIGSAAEPCAAADVLELRVEDDPPVLRRIHPGIDHLSLVPPPRASISAAERYW